MLNDKQRHEIAKQFNDNDLLFIPDDWKDNISAENVNQDVMDILTPSDDDDGTEVLGYIVTAKFFIENGYIADDADCGDDDDEDCISECDRAYELLDNAGIEYDMEAEAYILIYEELSDVIRKYNSTGARLFTPDTFTAALKDHGVNCTYEDLSNMT